jgi:hypothetical protein
VGCDCCSKPLDFIRGREFQMLELMGDNVKMVLKARVMRIWTRIM